MVVSGVQSHLYYKEPVHRLAGHRRMKGQNHDRQGWYNQAYSHRSSKGA